MGRDAGTRREEEVSMLVFVLLLLMPALAQFPPPASPATETASPTTAEPAVTTTPTVTATAPPPQPQVVYVETTPWWIWLVVVVAGVLFIVGLFLGALMVRARLDPFVRPFLESKNVAVVLNGPSIESYALDERNSYMGVDLKRGAVMPKPPDATPFKTSGGTNVYFGVKAGNYIIPTNIAPYDIALGVIVSEKCRSADTLDCAFALAEELSKIGSDSVYKRVPIGNMELYIRVPSHAISTMLYERLMAIHAAGASAIETLQRAMLNMEPRLLEHVLRELGGTLKSLGRWPLIIFIIMMVLIAVAAVSLFMHR